MIREQKQQFNKRIIEKGSTYAKFFSQNEKLSFSHYRFDVLLINESG